MEEPHNNTPLKRSADEWTCYFPGHWMIIKHNFFVRICNHRTQERWHERSWHSGSGNGTKPISSGGASWASWKATREVTVAAPALLTVLTGAVLLGSQSSSLPAGDWKSCFSVMNVRCSINICYFKVFEVKGSYIFWSIDPLHFISFLVICRLLLIE